MNPLHHLFGEPIGLTQREIDSWDWREFINAAGHGDARKLSFYKSVSDATVQKRGNPLGDFRAFAIPVDVLTRDMTTANTGAIVGTKNTGHLSSYLGRSLVGTLPLRRIGGLRENLTIPKGMGAASTTWLADQGSSTAEGDFATGQISLTPKNVATFVEVSHQLDRQVGQEGAAYIVGELGLGISKALDTALLAGTGNSGQPLSPFKTAGVGSTAGASINWAGICGLTTSAESVQVADKPSWVLGVNAASVLRQRERAAGNGYIFDDGRIAGYDAMVSQAAPTSSIFMAAWDSIVVASWGTMEISVDPFTGFRSGKIGMRAWLTVDFGCLHSGGLSVAESVS